MIHPSMLYALARSTTDDMLRRSERTVVRLAPSPRRTRSAEEHRYMQPRVVEVPRKEPRDISDDAVW